MSTSQLQSGYGGGGGGGGLTGFTSATSTTGVNASIGVSALRTDVAMADGDIVLNPKGSAGGILAQIPDGTAANGNKRGQQAVDFQLLRWNANQVAAGNQSAVITGNGNRCASDYGAVVSGQGNAIGTGIQNFIGSGFSCTINNGANNCAIVSGQSNTVSATGLRAFIGAGFSNTSASTNSFVGAGTSNNVQSTGTHGFIGAGEGNNVAATHGAILGGQSNGVWSAYSSILGGGNNAVNAEYSSSFGWFANNELNGCLTHSSGAQGIVGDTQFQQIIYGVITTDAVQAELRRAGGTISVANGFGLFSNGAAVFEIFIVAKQTGNHAASWRCYATLHHDGTTVSLLGTPQISLLGSVGNGANWSVAIASSTSPFNRIQILVTGQAATTIKWAATIRATRVAV
jgi:hypothetical protein